MVWWVAVEAEGRETSYHDDTKMFFYYHEVFLVFMTMESFGVEKECRMGRMDEFGSWFEARELGG
jgi:hypothetical protein